MVIRLILFVIQLVWLPLADGLSTWGRSKKGASVSPPGDVSGVGELAKTIHQVAAGRATKVAGEVGNVLARDIEEAAETAEAAIADPIGAVGGVVDKVAGVFDDDVSYTLVPTPSPTIPATGPLAKLRISITTTPLVPHNGVYCRGAACQYRATLPPTPYPGAPVVVAGTMPPPAEPCRGLACPPAPVDPDVVRFRQGCAHLLWSAPGGLKGKDDSRQPSDVRATFAETCKKRFPLTALACEDYADVFVGALAPDVNEETVGGTGNICNRLLDFINDMREAAVQLNLVGYGGASLLSRESRNAQSTGSTGLADGPCSRRGLGWRKWWLERHPEKKFAKLKNDSFLSNSRVAPHDENKPCKRSDTVVPAANMAYVIAPGSPDGAIKPVEIEGGKFKRCMSQMDEVTLGYKRPVPVMTQMVQQWCGFQSLMSSPDDPGSLPAHPEWDFRDCTAMAEYLTFALRKQSKAVSSATGALDACREMFLTASAVERVHSITMNAWSAGARIPLVGGAKPNFRSDAQQKLMKEMGEASKKFVKKLKREQAATAAVNTGKAAIANWRDGASSLLVKPVMVADIPRTSSNRVIADFTRNERPTAVFVDGADGVVELPASEGLV